MCDAAHADRSVQSASVRRGAFSSVQCPVTSARLPTAVVLRSKKACAHILSRKIMYYHPRHRRHSLASRQSQKSHERRAVTGVPHCHSSTPRTSRPVQRTTHHTRALSHVVAVARPFSFLNQSSFAHSMPIMERIMLGAAHAPRLGGGRPRDSHLSAKCASEREVTCHVMVQTSPTFHRVQQSGRG